MFLFKNFLAIFRLQWAQSLALQDFQRLNLSLFIVIMMLAGLAYGLVMVFFTPLLDVAIGTVNALENTLDTQLMTYADYNGVLLPDGESFGYLVITILGLVLLPLILLHFWFTLKLQTARLRDFDYKTSAIVVVLGSIVTLETIVPALAALIQFDWLQKLNSIGFIPSITLAYFAFFVASGTQATASPFQVANPITKLENILLFVQETAMWVIILTTPVVFLIKNVQV